MSHVICMPKIFVTLLLLQCNNCRDKQPEVYFMFIQLAKQKLENIFIWYAGGGGDLRNGGGGLLRRLVLEGAPEVHFTSPSYCHMASSLAEESSRPICGRESSPCNLYPRSNANFQFSTLGKQKVAHAEHSGQEP